MTEIPILTDLDSVGVHGHPVAGLKLKDVLEHCLRTRHIAQCKIQIQSLTIDFPWYPRVLQQRFDFRRKHEKVFPDVVIDWLDSEPVSHQQQSLEPAIPDGKCEHAAKIAHALRSIFLVSMNDRFRVGTSRECMPLGDQVPRKVGVVVDLTIENK